MSRTDWAKASASNFKYNALVSDCCQPFACLYMNCAKKRSAACFEWIVQGAIGSFFAIGFLLIAASLVRADDKQFAQDLVTPEMTHDEPAAGRRVYQVAPEYVGTEVYHALYLPVDWEPGKGYPVIIEYTGNRFAECGSSGEVKDANLGYGLTGGKGFLWISMPYIEQGGQRNSVTWWGDRQATVDYCKTKPAENLQVVWR